MTVLPTAVLLDLSSQHVADLHCAARSTAREHAAPRRSGGVLHLLSRARTTAARATRPATALQPCC